MTSSALPAGVGVPADSNPTSGPPRPEPVAASPTPGVCEGCRAGYPRFELNHYRLSEKTTLRGELVGPCSAPDAVPGGVSQEQHAASVHQRVMAWLERMKRPAEIRIAAEVLRPAPRGNVGQHLPAHWSEQEEDGNGD